MKVHYGSVVEMSDGYEYFKSCDRKHSFSFAHVSRNKREVTCKNCLRMINRFKREQEKKNREADRVSKRYKRAFKRLQEEEYYKQIHNLEKCKKFEDLYFAWFACFSFVMKDLSKGANFQIVKSIFCDWDMANWELMHKENSPIYKNKNTKQLKECFFGEICYCSDRMSYDRLFRCHWLFKQASDKLFYKIG